MNRKITKVYFWTNGMVTVFDQFGEQMPDYQGRREEVIEKIFRDAPPNVQCEINAEWFPGQMEQLKETKNKENGNGNQTP